MGLNKSFKNTDVGMIPNDWVVKRISDCVNISVGRDLKEDSFSKYQDNKYKYPVFSNTVDNEGLYGFYDFPEYKGNCVTVVGRGVGLGTAFKRHGGFGAIGRLLVLFPDEATDPGYLNDYINYRIMIYKESSGIPQLTGTSFGKYTIPLPPTTEEQSAIANALSDFDALIQSLKKLIEKKRLIKQGVMQKLFKPKKIWVVQKDDRHSFSDIFIKRNSKNHQIKTIEYRNSGKYAVIDQGKKQIIAYSDQVDKVFKCSDKGIIIFGDHTREFKFVDFDFVVGADGTQLLETRNGYYTKYIFYDLLTKIIPNTGYNRHFKFLKEFKFDVPQVEEQVRIATILSDLEKEIYELEAKLSKYKLIKQGMMQELLTGKTRLV